jgi:Flp pilus assembly protein TadD
MAPITIDQAIQIARQQRQSGRLAEAEKIYRQILRERPDHVDAIFLLGTLTAQMGRPDVGVELIRRAIQLKPNFSAAHTNLGAVLASMGQFEGAISAFGQVVRLKPGDADALVNLGNALHNSGRPGEAIPLYRQAIGLRPFQPATHYKLGRSLMEIKQFDEAVTELGTALKQSPQFYKAIYCLGWIMLTKGGTKEALVHLRKACELGSHDPQAHLVLATALEADGQFQEWQACCTRWNQLHPNTFLARLYTARMLLAMGNEKLAWQMLFTANELVDPLAEKFSSKLWTGRDPAGQTILVYSDGVFGFGDSILLARFIPILKQRGANVILQCRLQLTALYESLRPDAIVDLEQTPPAFDWYAPLRTVAHRLGFEIDSIPNAVPYLAAPPDRVRLWADRIPSDKKKNVGLVWAGSEAMLRTQSVDIFAPLAQISGIRWFSLQKGPQSAQQPPAGMEWVDLTSEINDFADTGALVQQLDLVIGVDTATVHLAGALGKPVWIVLPLIRNFFWMMDGEHSRWYPTARLFRQMKMGDWETPIGQIVGELRKWA